MVEYKIVREKERTFIFAAEGDFKSLIEIHPFLFEPESLLCFFQANEVAPEHLQNVYDDLLYQKVGKAKKYM